MACLILGMLIWFGAHAAPIYARDRLSGVGDWWRGLVAAALCAAIFLIWLGWNSDAGLEIVYNPADWGRHLNNLLMLFAVWLVSAGHMKTNTARRIRHPMLAAMIVWSVAHLAANGTAQDLILFGGMGVWAAVSMVSISARDGAWTRPGPRPRKKDLIHIAASLVAFGLIALAHWKLGGVYPFPG